MRAVFLDSVTPECSLKPLSAFRKKGKFNTARTASLEPYSAHLLNTWS